MFKEQIKKLPQFFLGRTLISFNSNLGFVTRQDPKPYPLPLRFVFSFWGCPVVSQFKELMEEHHQYFKSEGQLFRRVVMKRSVMAKTHVLSDSLVELVFIHPHMVPA